MVSETTVTKVLAAAAAITLTVMSATGVALATPCVGPTIGPAFAANYTCNDLGGPPGVPGPLGGLTFLNNNTLLIGGSANTLSADIFSIGVTRGLGNHITAFSGLAASFADAPGVGFGGIDGGLSFGPGGVLFYTSYSDNSLGQIKPGSTAPDKQTVLTPFGISSSVGTLVFVPGGFPGAGKFKIASFNSSDVYDVTLAPDGGGTFNVMDATQKVDLGSTGPEGIVYVAAGNPGFVVASVLVSEYSIGEVGAYDVDANGDPIPVSRRILVDNLFGAEGAVIDPLSGDFLFSTFGGGNQVVVIQGFIPPEPVPEPGTIALLGAGILAALGSRYLPRRCA